MVSMLNVFLEKLAKYEKRKGLKGRAIPLWQKYALDIINIKLGHNWTIISQYEFNTLACDSLFSQCLLFPYIKWVKIKFCLKSQTRYCV